MTTKVAVIGAGPAGLLAAWGAIQEPEVSVRLFDPNPEYRPDRIFSLQYLHSPVNLQFTARRLRLYYQVQYAPGMSDQIYKDREAAKNLYNLKLGRPLNEENSTKFLWDSPVSVYSLKDAYRFLHNHFRSKIQNEKLLFDDIIGPLAEEYDVVVSTAPLDKLFPTRSWPARVSFISMAYTPVKHHAENTCVYNLDPDIPWTRATRLDGGTATEWASQPGSVIELDKDVASMTRPLRKVVRADWYPPLPRNVVLAGRWGSWDPSQLTHHAFYKARDAVWESRNARTV